MVRGRGSRHGQDTKKRAWVIVGHFSGTKVKLEKESFKEVAWKLLKTMRSPKLTPAVKEAAEEKLFKLLADHRGEIRKNRELVLRGRKIAELEKDELIHMNLIAIWEAEVDIIEALYKGFKPESLRMQMLIEKANKLRAEREALTESKGG